jgi:DNA-binding LytR/AlgR family response regulator
VFIDVRMPDLDGIELARVLRRFDRPPSLVFVSAYESGAVEAFEVQALDYLMKPVSRTGLERAIGRVNASLDGERTGAAPAATESNSSGLEGDVRVAVDDGRYLLRCKMSEIERAWEPHGFARIHRSYVANLRRAVEIRPRLNGTATLILAGGIELPIARRKIAALRSRLHI